MIPFVIGVIVGALGAVLVALAGDPFNRGARLNPSDTTSLWRQTERFSDEMDEVQSDPVTFNAYMAATRHLPRYTGGD